VFDVVVKKFTFTLSSSDELLVFGCCGSFGNISAIDCLKTLVCEMICYATLNSIAYL